LSTSHQKGAERVRHSEAKLARDMGTSPVVELHGVVKVRAGRVVGVFVGPHDAAEMLAVAEFKTSSAFEEGTMRFGYLQGVPFYLLDDDFP
jgi:hypothetical protein